MSDEIWQEELENEFDIDDSYDICFKLLEGFSSNESIEIIVDDNLIEKVAEDESTREKVESLFLAESIPPIDAVEVSDIPVAANYESSKEASNTCKNCGKTYKRKHYFKKHVLSCIPVEQTLLQQDLAGEKNDKTTKGSAVQKANEKKVVRPRMSRKKGILSNMVPEDIEKYFVQFVNSSLDDAISDQTNNMKVGSKLTPGNNTVLFAQKIKSFFENHVEDCNKVCYETCITILDLLKGVDLLRPESQELMWEKFLLNIESRNTFNDSLKKITLFEEENETPESIRSSLSFFVGNRLIAHMTKHINESLTNESINVSETEELTSSSQQILHYVTGFVVFAMMKKYKSIQKSSPNPTPDVDASLAFFRRFDLKNSKNEAIQGNDFHSFISNWTELVNRGGLVNVNQEFLTLFVKIEKHVQKVLSIQNIQFYKGEDLRDMLETSIFGDMEINNYWSVLSRKLPHSKLSKLLYSQVIRKWVDLRANAFVKLFLQILKRVTATGSTQLTSAKSMRHDLKE